MKNRCSRSVWMATLSVILLYSNPTWAAQIKLPLANGIIVNADYRQGAKDQAAVFVLHGFMATYSLNIIQTMATELEDHGYTVLAPTLSLNTNNRRGGANCGAVHTHTMESDVDEIAWWIDWLIAKDYKKIILVGFSTGALQVTIYLNTHKNPHIQKVILLSPAYLAGKPFSAEVENMDRIKAEKLLAAHNEKLKKYSLSYCKANFLAPPNVYLSYKAWTMAKLLNGIKKISLPKSVIVGSNDHRFEIHLDDKLKKTGARFISIKGADHFFDSPYEFDFLDAFMSEIEAK